MVDLDLVFFCSFCIITSVSAICSEGVYLQAPPGHFILFMPEDAHKPNVYFKQAGLIRKLVLKVRLQGS